MSHLLEAKALVIEQSGDNFKLVDIQLDPKRLASDEVIVRFKHTGVCHTDIHSRNTSPADLLPAIYGHEGVGIVEHVSNAYTGPFHVGDTVLASFCSCGSCNNCQSARSAFCDSFVPMNLAHFTKDGRHVTVPYKHDNGAQGEARIHYFGQSSFSSLMSVNDRSLTKISSNVPTQLAAALACGFQTGFATVFEKAPSDKQRSFELFEAVGASIPASVKTSATYERSKQTLLVSGLGGVGLGAIYAGRVLGFGAVIAADINESRLQLAKEVGASHTVQVKGLDQDAFVAKVKDCCPDGRGASLAIEASGSAAALANDMKALSVGGRLAIVGIGPDTATVPYMQLLPTATSLEGLLMGNSHPEVTIPFLVSKLEAGELKFLKKMVKVYKPVDMNIAVQDQESGQVIKPVIEWT